MKKPAERERGGAESSSAGRLSIEDADLASQRSRSKLIRNHPELLRTDVVSYLADSVPRLVRSDRRRALNVAELALTIASSLGDTEGLAQSLRAKGNALHGLGRNRGAAEHHQRALQLFRAAGNPDQIARTLSTSIQPLILLGKHDQALVFAREAREIFSRRGDQWRLARLELNLGNIFDRRDFFKEALASYESAYRYLSTNNANDPEALAAALHNIAVSCIRLNDFRKAQTTYEQARRFAAEHEMPVLVAQADYNIACLHYLRAAGCTVADLGGNGERYLLPGADAAAYPAFRGLIEAAGFRAAGSTQAMHCDLTGLTGLPPEPAASGGELYRYRHPGDGDLPELLAVAGSFSAGWAGLIRSYLGRTERAENLWIARGPDGIAGFAGSDLFPGCPGRFGPMGVVPAARGHGAGSRLLRLSLASMAGRGRQSAWFLWGPEGESGRRMYASAGFQASRQFDFFRLDLHEPRTPDPAQKGSPDE